MTPSSSTKTGSANVKSSKASAKAALDEPLVTVHNPFRYIFYWLEDVKNWIKKDSNGEIRLHIPFKWFVTALIIVTTGGAIPAYWQGKAVEYAWWIAKPTPTPVVIVQPTLTPAPVLVTRLGIIKATYQVRNLMPSPTPPPPESSPSSSLNTQNSALGTDSPTRFVLMTDTYKLIYLQMPADVTLSKFIGYKALVTGLYTNATNTLSIDKLEDIEILY